MKVFNLEIAVSQRADYIYVDDMNNTFMSINGKILPVEDTEHGSAVFVPELKEGDFVSLTTRSSSWSGVVEYSCFSEAHLKIEGEGVFASITGGMSGLITWTLLNTKYATIETSLWDTPVSFDAYVAARGFANTFDVDIEERNFIITKLLTIASCYSLPTPPEPFVQQEEEAFFFIAGDDEFLTDEELLGAATLAKIRSGKPVFSDDDC